MSSILCRNCGEPNKSHALRCAMCGEPFARRIEDEMAEDRRRADASLTAPTKGPAVLKPDTPRAMRFLLLVLLLQGVPTLLWLGSTWFAQHGVALGDANGPQQSAIRAGLMLLFIIGNAFLIAKTGESLGARFLSNFLMACIPPLLPAVWARIGGKSALKPYVYLLADIAILVAVALMVRENVIVSAIAALLLIPVAIYQLYGCAVREVSTPLGLNSEVSLVWICFGPLLLIVVLLLDGAHDWAMQWYSQSLADFVDTAVQIANIGLIQRSEMFQFVLCVYLLASWLVWVRAVYQGLKLPVM